MHSLVKWTLSVVLADGTNPETISDLVALGSAFSGALLSGHSRSYNIAEV